MYVGMLREVTLDSMEGRMVAIIIIIIIIIIIDLNPAISRRERD